MIKNYESWSEVGRIAYEVLTHLKSKVKPNRKILELCEYAENLIRQQGYEPAFPVNISVNEIAAHYTSPPGDESRIPHNAVVKLDLGVLSRDGAISDTAITVYLGNDKNIIHFVKSAREVLQEAIENIKAGIRAGEIGRIIWRAAHKRGYGVLTDLGGHAISNWTLHAGITVPNVYNRYTPKLKAGTIVAIEPFLVFSRRDSSTTPDMNRIYIFAIRRISEKIIKKDKILGLLYKKYRNMPFAIRWLKRAKANKNFAKSLERYLISQYYENKVNMYPTLIEIEGNLVAQFEHTILVKENSAEILTIK